MHNWQENEVKELLTIRGSEAIRHQITGTVKDSVVYNRMTKLLAERGVYRSHMQVISKLKALRKQYSKYQQLRLRGGGGGSGRVDWPFYEQCHRAFGNGPAPAGNPVKRRRSPTPPPVTAPSPPPPPPPRPPAPPPPVAPPRPANSDQEVVVSLWDEVDDGEINKHLGPVEADDDDDELYSPAEPLQPARRVLSRKRKTTVMEQVSTLMSATVAQLREMDASMQAQEDARLQRLMDHERDMQDNLMSQLVAMHERMSRENHERHLELVDRILSRLPSGP